MDDKETLYLLLSNEFYTKIFKINLPLAQLFVPQRGL